MWKRSVCVSDWSAWVLNQGMRGDAPLEHLTTPPCEAASQERKGSRASSARIKLT